MKINIAYSSDNNYARHVGVSMLSVFQNNNHIDEIVVYILDNGIDPVNKTELTNIADSYFRKIVFYDFNMLSRELKTDNQYNLSSYGRLFLSRLQEVDKIIYLDCDSIILDKLDELWNMNIDDYYIAGVKDTVNEFYKTSIYLESESDYINAGFLLINLKNWRVNDLENQFLNFIDDFKGSVPHHDQGTINSVCRNKILILHPKYNVQCPMFYFSNDQIKEIYNISNYYDQEELDSAVEKPLFIHFTNGFFNRPWHINSTHPYTDKYLFYLSQTIWKDDVIKKDLILKVKILKWIYSKLPFQIYLKINKIINKRKEKELELKNT